VVQELAGVACIDRNSNTARYGTATISRIDHRAGTITVSA
jgi:hypothetical protein